MRIRAEQMESFQDAAVRNFEDQTLRHLQTFAPRHYDVLGQEGTRPVVRLGMERAERYGFTDRRPVRFYIELMFLFGSYFDSDPQFRWITDTMSNPTADQGVRADKIHADLMRYLDDVAGPGNEYAIAALRRMREEAARPWVTTTDLREGLVGHLKAIYPRKCRHLGDQTLLEIVQLGLQSARSHGVSSVGGAVLFADLTFILGHGFTRDPLFPWISGTLDNDAIADPNQRAERLGSKSLTYADRVLGNLASN